MNIILSFITGFIIKYFTTPAMEKVVLVILKRLVQSTESKVDDEIYQAVFEKVEEK